MNGLAYRRRGCSHRAVRDRRKPFAVKLKTQQPFHMHIENRLDVHRHVREHFAESGSTSKVKLCSPEKLLLRLLRGSAATGAIT